MKKIGEINNLLIVSIPKPFGAQFVAHIRNTLTAIRTSWASLIIHFSNENATNNDKQAAGYLKWYFLNFKYYAECCAFEDLL